MNIDLRERMVLQGVEEALVLPLQVWSILLNGS